MHPLIRAGGQADPAPTSKQSLEEAQRYVTAFVISTTYDYKSDVAIFP